IALTPPVSANDTVSLTVRIFQACTDNLGNPIPAVVKGTTSINASCRDALSLNDPNACAAGSQLGALEVISCTPAPAGINCDATSIGTQVERIPYSKACTRILGSGTDCFTLGTGTNTVIATIQVRTIAGQQIFSPANGQFAITGSVGASNIDSGAA